MSLFTRRGFGKLSLAALAGGALDSGSGWLRAADAAPVRSGAKGSGVRIGLNVPYSFSSPQMSGSEILKNCVQLGLDGVELRTQPVEIFLGAPPELIFPKNAAAGAAKTDPGDLRAWRKSAPLSKVAQFRKQYEDAGILIEIVKVDGIFKMADDELDYVFTLAKALGGRAISTEISLQESDLKRVGQFADKHELMVGYHAHTKTGPAEWEQAFTFAKHNGANVDLGHFVAGQNTSPVPFIKAHHDRITHVHVKDRKMHDGPNTVFGEGDTPIVEALRLIRDNKWNIQATIEFEYKVPAGSDRMTELARSVKFCRDALAS